MKLRCVCILTAALVVCSVSAFAKLAATPGRVTMYNQTNESVSFTIVGQDMHIHIEGHKKLAYTFGPNKRVRFWYWKNNKKVMLGEATVNAGAVLAITYGGVKVKNPGIAPAPTAMDKAAPDFSNPKAVFADLKKKSAECKAKKAPLCVTRCNYAHKTLSNFIRLNPEGDPSIFKQRWKPCYDDYVKGK